MDNRPVERRLAAILSADVEGYSRLMGEDEAATVRTITEYREVIASTVSGRGGRVVDASGDNVLAEFPSVVDAVQCAVDVQRKLEARNAPLPASRRQERRDRAGQTFHSDPSSVLSGERSEPAPGLGPSAAGPARRRHGARGGEVLSNGSRTGGPRSGLPRPAPR